MDLGKAWMPLKNAVIIFPTSRTSDLIQSNQESSNIRRGSLNTKQKFLSAPLKCLVSSIYYWHKSRAKFSSVHLNIWKSHKLSTTDLVSSHDLTFVAALIVCVAQFLYLIWRSNRTLLVLLTLAHWTADAQLLHTHITHAYVIKKCKFYFKCFYFNNLNLNSRKMNVQSYRIPYK